MLRSSIMNYCGIDISTRRIGIAIVDDDENLVAYKTESLASIPSHKERRRCIVESLYDLVDDFGIDEILTEEVRLFSYGGRNFINFNTIFRLLACIVSIIDNIDASILTIGVRSWKSKILTGRPYLKGSKSGKEGAVRFIKDKYGIDVNHDLADSICIALFLKRHRDKCKVLE